MARGGDVEMHVAASRRKRPELAMGPYTRDSGELVATQARLREAHEVARLSSWEWRPESDEVVVFQALPDVAELSGTRVSFNELLGAMSADDRKLARSDLEAMARGEREASTRSCQYDLPTGQAWLETRSRAIRDRDGQLKCVRGTTQDVTEQHLAEAEISTQAALLDEVDVAVIAMDNDDRVTRWNDAAEGLFGYTSSEALGHRAARLIAGDDPDGAADAIAGTERAGRWQGRLTFRSKDGFNFPADVRVRQMLNDGGQAAGRIAVLVDVTERVASERALLAAQNYARAVADSMGEGLCTIDPQGHLIYMNEAAERLLGWAAEDVKGRLLHDLVHPYLPDEEHCAADPCPIVRARHERETVRVEEDAFTCRDGRSLPVAYTAAPFVTDDGIDGCAIVFEDITERKEHQASMERDVETLSWIRRVQEALAQDRFELFGQPIIDLRSGEVVQRELLLRMREPDGEIVAPISYLPIAEQYGLIADIDEWVIGRATEIAAEVGAVELNLSARSIGNPAILDRIERCLQTSGADPSSLVFEITETALIADEAAAKIFVDRVHAIGCKLALDDFGTGYGGFTYLKHLPVDLLKIDVEFVGDLVSNAASRHVVEAVVALARAFGLKTVAEGVEDAVALEAVRELGVDFAQGYFIARPAPLDFPLLPISSTNLSVDATPPERTD